MDELLDILDTNGNLTGETALKSVAHREGLFHKTVHIWFYTADKSLLLQQRGKNKETHPLLWDVSVAGHIGAGEQIEIAALREIKEEIGVVVSAIELQKIGVFKSEQKHRNGLLDYEFHHTFISMLSVPLEILERQESEIELLKLISINDFSLDVLEGKNLEKYVPHTQHYYRNVYDAMSKRLR